MAKNKNEEKTIKVRVLARIDINGITYEPDEIAEIDPDTLETLRAHVDPHPDAVAYIEGNK